MASLKIALVVSQSAGGIGTHVSALAAALRQLGHNVIVLTDTTTATRFDFGSHLDANRLPLTLTGTWRAAIQGADILHAHGHRAGLLAHLWLQQLPRRARPRLAISWHNDFPTHGLRGTLRAFAAHTAISRADIVAGASSDLCDLASNLGAHITFLERVPSPLVPELLSTTRPSDTERVALREHLYQALAQAHTRQDLPVQSLPTESSIPALAKLPLILTTARWAPQKQLDFLAQIATHLETEAVWDVLGDGDLPLAQHAADLAQGASTHLYFLGRSTQVQQWLRASDVFVLPSRWEARALVLQEAMALGVPTVATNAGGIPDLLGGQAGFLCENKDVHGFARAVTLALSPEGETRALKARSIAAGFPTINALAQQWVKLYLGALTHPQQGDSL